MIKELITLAFQGMIKKRARSLLLFLVLFLSFTAAIVSISTVGSISYTNTEYKLEVYGRWTLAVPSGIKEDEQWFQQQPWVDQMGSSQYYGQLSTENQTFGFGTIDQTLIDLGPINLDKIQDKNGQWTNSSWPKNGNEIAMEAKILTALGYEAVKGNIIDLVVSVPYEVKDETGNVISGFVEVEKTFNLCGIIDEYTGLWNLEQNTEEIPLVGAVVTEDTAVTILEAANNCLSLDFEGAKSIPQYFLYVQESYRDISYEETKEWMQESRNNNAALPSKNTIAYSAVGEADSNEYYTYAIALVAMLTVLCSYTIQLPFEIKSFSILRSIGITRSQMLFLIVVEALLLCTPAILLGIPSGLITTWLILKCYVYTGSVPVLVSVPHDVLYSIILLWLAIIIISRLVVFLISIRAPLTGSMHFKIKKYHRLSKICNILIVLLISLFGAVVTFTEMSSLSPKEKIFQAKGMPSYTIGLPIEVEVAAGQTPKTWFIPLTENEIALIKEVPGVEDAYGINTFSQMTVYAEEMNDISMVLLTLPADKFEETLHLGKAAENFENGEYIIMCFPDFSSENLTAGPYQIPEGSITLLGYDISGKCVLKSEPTPVSVYWVQENFYSRSINFASPYTIICSKSYLSNLLEDLQTGETWGIYTGGEGFGYSEIYVTVSSNAKNLSTDNALISICKRMNATIINDREILEEVIQLNTQELLLLYTAEICIVLVLLFILGSALTLEAQQEVRHFAIMRCIGMSKRQMNVCILTKAFVRGVIAVIAGWGFYWGYIWVKALLVSDTAQMLEQHLLVLKLSGLDWELLLLISCFCLIVPLIVTLLVKSKMLKGVQGT